MWSDLKKAIAILRRIQSRGVCHCEDCISLMLDDEECNCGCDELELDLKNFLEEYDEEK